MSYYQYGGGDAMVDLINNLTNTNDTIEESNKTSKRPHSEYGSTRKLATYTNKLKIGDY